jgi:hypothetical protein
MHLDELGGALSETVALQKNAKDLRMIETIRVESKTPHPWPFCKAPPTIGME